MNYHPTHKLRMSLLNSYDVYCSFCGCDDRGQDIYKICRELKPKLVRFFKSNPEGTAEGHGLKLN
jgi:hypothetical protein